MRTGSHPAGARRHGRRRCGWLWHGPRPASGLLCVALLAACGPGAPSDQVEIASRDAESAAEALHPEAGEAISKLRSPFCPGLMLEVCPSFEAEALRDSIQMGAVQGLSADSLVEWMIAGHGEEYRAFPKRSGAGLLAWVAPPVALLMGLALVVIVLRRLRGREPVAAGAGGLTDDEQARLDEALAELEAMEDVE